MYKGERVKGCPYTKGYHKHILLILQKNANNRIQGETYINFVNVYLPSKGRLYHLVWVQGRTEKVVRGGVKVRDQVWRKNSFFLLNP